VLLFGSPVTAYEEGSRFAVCLPAVLEFCGQAIERSQRPEEQRECLMQPATTVSQQPLQISVLPGRDVKGKLFALFFLLFFFASLPGRLRTHHS